MRLIDADSLDETITRLNEQDWGITRNEYKLIDRVIFEMPTVDVHESGEWIELPKALDTNENPCKCSVCGHILSFMHGYPKSNFCPQCGARMIR